MAKVDVSKWFEYEDSRKLELQAKYFIASEVEGYLNGCYDDDYEAMTIEEWKQYIWSGIEMEKGMYINGNESSHIYFLGKAKVMNLVDIYLANYQDVQNFIKR